MADEGIRPRLGEGEDGEGDVGGEEIVTGSLAEAVVDGFASWWGEG